MRFLLSGLLALTLGMGTVRAETPTEAVDRVWNAFVTHDPKEGHFPKEFWVLCKTVAQEQGVSVIIPIMARAKDWKDEEGLAFVPLVALLPQDPTMAILNRYKKEGKSWEQQAADDFLIELNSDDLKEAQREFSTH